MFFDMKCDKISKNINGVNMPKFFINYLTIQKTNGYGEAYTAQTGILLHCSEDIKRLETTGLDKSPYIIAHFPLVEGVDFDNQKDRARLLCEILNQHHELTPEISSRILNTTKSSMESDALMRSVSFVPGNNHSSAL